MVVVFLVQEDVLDCLFNPPSLSSLPPSLLPLSFHSSPDPLLFPQRRVAAKGDYQVVKQDQEELGNVCKVMEDLIRMHLSIFTVGVASFFLCTTTSLSLLSSFFPVLLSSILVSSLLPSPDPSPSLSPCCISLLAARCNTLSHVYMYVYMIK